VESNSAIWRAPPGLGVSRGSATGAPLESGRTKAAERGLLPKRSDWPGVPSRACFLNACFAEGFEGYYDAIATHAYSEGAAPEATYATVRL
jgi:hypothetical protein